MESFDKNGAATEEVPSKKVRLDLILKIIAEGPPSKNAEEASALISNSFEKVENELVPDVNERMSVYALKYYFETAYKDKKIYYFTYNHHVLFIDENGAIDIRTIDRKKPFTHSLLEKQRSFPKEEMGLLFEKPGGNGSRVWD